MEATTNDANAAMAELIATWHSAQVDFIALAEALDEDHWRSASACPGWTNGDVVAHVLDLEARMLGEVIDHEPNWDDLPHTATSDSRVTEIGVDARRGQPQARVLAELQRVVAQRLNDLQAGPQDPATPAKHPFGFELPLGRLLQMRTLDSWVHEQDIRAVIGQPGNLDSAAAQSTADQLLSGLPMVWGKRVAPPPGATLLVSITGPGVERLCGIRLEPDGRARVCDPMDEPSVVLTASWPTMLAALAGRPTTEVPDASGEAELVGRLLENLRLVP